METLTKKERIEIIDNQIQNARRTGHESIIPPLENEKLAVENEMEISDIVEPQLREHGYTPTDEIRPELIPLVEQWSVDKSAEQVDRLISALSKN